MARGIQNPSFPSSEARHFRDSLVFQGPLISLGLAFSDVWSVGVNSSFCGTPSGVPRLYRQCRMLNIAGLLLPNPMVVGPPSPHYFEDENSGLFPYAYACVSVFM